MAYRSWLEKAKSVHDLGNHFYIHTAGKPWDCARDAKAEANWRKPSEKPIPVGEEFKDYFGSRMHDSGFEAFERSGEVLRVKLSSDEALGFSGALASVLGVEEVDRRWPVDLLLHDPALVRTVRHDPSGTLRHSNLDKPASNDQFLYDWFFEQEGRIQWVAQFWCWRRETHKLSTDLFLLVDASHATADDRCPQAMEAAYGPGARILWNDAHQGVDTGSPPKFRFWGIRDFGEYMKRRIEAHGLRTEDFRPSKSVSQQGSPNGKSQSSEILERT